jgi:hypothetical protein
MKSLSRNLFIYGVVLPAAYFVIAFLYKHYNYESILGTER